MNATTFAILTSVIIFLAVLESIRRQHMTFKYSLFWLTACLAVLFLAVNHQLLGRISDLAGFSLPSNFVFFLVLAFFIVQSLAMTVHINEQNTRTETLAQAIAILEFKLEDAMKRKYSEASSAHQHRNP